MPWCAGCDRFLSPSTVTPTGACPRCGAPVDPGRARAATPGESALVGEPTPIGSGGEAAAPDLAPAAGAAGAAGGDDDPEETTVPLPWHFKLLVGAIVAYLAWRAIQGIDWVVRLV